MYSHNLTIVMSAKDNSGGGGLVEVGEPQNRKQDRQRRRKKW